MKLKSVYLSLPVVAILMSSPIRSVAASSCPSARTGITITSGVQGDNALICAGAQQALDLLAHCTITPRGKINIKIQSEVRHPLAGPIFGYYDLEQRHIVLTTLASLPALMEGTPYSGIPPIEFYKSLVTHEVVHNVMHQNLGSRTQNPAAYEYPAYALQIESLPVAARVQFLEAFDKERIARAAPFSDAILAFDPYFFAARAYTHFKSSFDRCASLRSVIVSETNTVMRR